MMIAELIDSDDLALLENGLVEKGIPNTYFVTEQMLFFMDMTLQCNEVINLTTITEPREFIRKHFLDALFCYGWQEIEAAERIVDVGTGAGIPGIPLAMAYPEKQFLLMDSLSKRIGFLQTAVDAMGLSNVSVMHMRAEDAGRNPKYREKYDLCVSRALAKLPVLSEYCLPLVRPGGYFYAYKTDNALGEIVDSETARKLLGAPGEVLVRAADAKASLYRHNIMVIKKELRTPETYPRKAGTPAKVPL
ncbi:MAG: 16S rRNA (guanine(527)-N(7))-methyltransferase RsmG [Clostridiales Family XIII bacterium]|jgi:16S rRNA (guanine527-N7)-methyltransferase|nr:16S rRNA (guanine(527)-N(7))-methyltransferase RsmG [Clostridiales Family XIII bacterium]